MIHAFFDGENLAEILQDGSARAMISYINQDASQLPASEISQKTGVDTLLFADYESREACQSIR